PPSCPHPSPTRRSSDLSPVDDPQLVAPAGTALPVVLKKPLPVHHEGPTPEHVVRGVHRGGVGKPGGAGSHPCLMNAEGSRVHLQDRKSTRLNSSHQITS